MTAEIPSWDKFAWAVFYYGIISKDVTGNSDYLKLMHDAQFLQDLRINPNSLRNDRIQDDLLKGFLNPWNCRIENSNETANDIRITLQNLTPYLQALLGLRIENVMFSYLVNVNDVQKTISQVIEHCYEKVKNIGHKFGDIAASKLLHILRPELFVMWDNLIITNYHENNRQVLKSGRGYCAYLQIMQQIANQIHAEFQNMPFYREFKTPADYLNIQMKYNPPKTMAKYLDEFNWVKSRYEVPPVWHP